MMLSRTCLQCGLPFTRRQSKSAVLAGSGKHCSKKCVGSARSAVPLADRFWAKVNKDGPVPPHHPELGPCWVWTAVCLPRGYGQFKSGAGLAHRFSWELHFGPIPSGLWVLHSCDNPSCVRPEHLFLGTHVDNVRDAVGKGRNAFGERSGQAKLTEAQVAEIKVRLAMGFSQMEIAREYGVAQTSVFRIRHGLTWSHVPCPDPFARELRP